MQRVARWIARRLWWGSLWLMRRRGIRRLQSASFRWLPAARAEKARRGLVRQNALARRIGLPMITLLVTLVMASVAIQLVAWAALSLVDSGVLRPRNPSAETLDGETGQLAEERGVARQVVQAP